MMFPGSKSAPLSASARSGLATAGTKIIAIIAVMTRKTRIVVRVSPINTPPGRLLAIRLRERPQTR